ncbi:flavin-binding monooxygenase protein [Rutstroemia sp. NJR-2017a BVV2]|nr:flavin-binding monooxygenase protein [Rutstroemia sp. NJR-2017a BVV2]
MARGAMGGTWDLFRFPGIRSDSDLHTFGFPWRPWQSPKSLADGESIRTYIKESAEEYGIDRNIRFHHRVLSADWSTDDQQWSVTVEADGMQSTLKGRWIIWGTGYYDYNEPLKVDIPGLENFQGKVIHPQFWPEDLDYTNKRIAVIGSGATAVTLIPNLVDKAAKVTMVQRSPSYVMGVPNVDPSAELLRKYLPSWMASQLIRWKYLMIPLLFFNFCRTFPNFAKKLVKRGMQAELPPSVSVDPHFNPRYTPWEQRLCACPDNDFFKCLGSGKADVVTGSIKTVTADSIVTESGDTVDVDIIVTATGLKMLVGGHAKISVDGEPFDFAAKYVWKGVMLQDLPNSCIVFGYANASWTLGADATAQMVCRMLKHMDSNNFFAAIPRVQRGESLKPKPMLNLNSTYIEKAKGLLPKGGDKGPWVPRTNYFVDYWVARYGSLTQDMEFIGREHDKDL